MTCNDEELLKSKAGLMKKKNVAQKIIKYRG